MNYFLKRVDMFKSFKQRLVGTESIVMVYLIHSISKEKQNNKS